MESQERVKKQEPGRTQPIRNWGVVFEQPTPAPSSPPPGNSVSQGVEMGYQVVEEYLRQGQNVARGMGGPPGPGVAPAGDGLQNQLGALLRTFADFASLWMNMMGKVSAGGASAHGPGVAPPVGTAGPFSVGTAPGPARAPEASEEQEISLPALTVDLDSTRRAQVSIHLHPRPLDRAFRVHDLLASEPNQPRLRGVTVEAVPEEERVVLRLRIPDEQPPGSYYGIILDERTGLPRGTLCVRVAP